MRFSWIFRTILTYVGNLYVLPGSSGGGGGSSGDGDGSYFACPHCDKAFSLRSGRNKHVKRIHQSVRVPCRHGCGKNMRTTVKVSSITRERVMQIQHILLLVEVLTNSIFSIPHKVDKWNKYRRHMKVILDCFVKISMPVEI